MAESKTLADARPIDRFAAGSGFSTIG